MLELRHDALGDLQTPGDLDLARRFGVTEFVQANLLLEAFSAPYGHIPCDGGQPSRRLPLPLAFAATVLESTRRRVVICTHAERPLIVVVGIDRAAVALGDMRGTRPIPMRRG